MAKTAYIKGDIIQNDNKWIYDWIGWESTCPKDILDVLKEVNGTDDIIIEMNSGGGSVIAAHEIYTAILNYNGNIEIHVVGIAGSAASEILTACKNKITNVGVVMIHNCSSSASGDYRDMDSASQMLQVINQSIRNAYKAKTGLSDEKLVELMDNTTWMSAEEAVEYGFVDEIIKAEPQCSISNVMNRRPIDFYNSSTGIPQDTIEKLKNILLQEKGKNIIEKNKESENQIKNNADNPAPILNKTIPEGRKEMKLEDLLKENPDAADELATKIEAAKNEGAAEERSRLQSIDNIASIVSEAMLNKAKYEEPINAAELALQLATETATSGKKYFEAAVKDSNESNVNQVTATPTETDVDPDEALMNMAVQSANAKRKGAN